MSGASIDARWSCSKALADEQRFTVEAAYLALTANVVVAAIQEASLRGQIDATRQIIALNRKALDILLPAVSMQATPAVLTSPLQEATLAQEEATLPPLLKATGCFTRDPLLTALLGRYPNEQPY